MAVDADAAASALAASWQHFVGAMPGWAKREGGVLAAMSGVALANCNGVWAGQVDPDEDLVAALLSEVATAGLPCCLQLRLGASLALTNLRGARGMVPGAQVPLMVLEGSGALGAAQHVDRLEIRELTPEAVQEHVTIAASGFGAPEELMAQLATPALLRTPGVAAMSARLMASGLFRLHPAGLRDCRTLELLGLGHITPRPRHDPRVTPA
jgi:hypothetical protein